MSIIALDRLVEVPDKLIKPSCVISLLTTTVILPIAIVLSRSSLNSPVSPGSVSVINANWLPGVPGPSMVIVAAVTETVCVVLEVVSPFTSSKVIVKLTSKSPAAA